LNVAQILAIDLGTDLLPALALGTEQPEHETMQGAPPKRRQPLINNRLIGRALWLGGLETLLCYAAYSLVRALADPITPFGFLFPEWLDRAAFLAMPPEQVDQMASTVFFVGVIMAQIGSAIASRSERIGVRRLGFFRNGFLWVGILCEIGVALALIYVKPLATLFGHAPFASILWALLGSFAFVMYGLDRARKMVFRGLRRTARPEGIMR